jgi:hypothetical protein
VLALTSCSDAVAPIIPVPASVTLSVNSHAFSSLGQTHQISATIRDQSGASMGGVERTVAGAEALAS